MIDGDDCNGIVDWFPAVMAFTTYRTDYEPLSAYMKFIFPNPFRTGGKFTERLFFDCTSNVIYLVLL